MGLALERGHWTCSRSRSTSQGVLGILTLCVDISLSSVHSSLGLPCSSSDPISHPGLSLHPLLPIDHSASISTPLTSQPGPSGLYLVKSWFPATTTTTNSFSTSRQETNDFLVTLIGHSHRSIETERAIWAPSHLPGKRDWAKVSTVKDLCIPKEQVNQQSACIWRKYKRQEYTWFWTAVQLYFWIQTSRVKAKISISYCSTY